MHSGHADLVSLLLDFLANRKTSSVLVSEAEPELHSRAGKLIKTTEAFSCLLSKTICFPSGVISNVRIVDRSLNRVKRRVLIVPRSNSQKS